MEMNLVVEDATAERIRLRLDGQVEAGCRFEDYQATYEKEPEKIQTLFKAKQSNDLWGYEVKLLGFLEFDRKKDQFTRFDVVGLGDVWAPGLNAYMNGGSFHVFLNGGDGGEPTKWPTGMAITLADDRPANRTYPTMTHKHKPWQLYWEDSGYTPSE